MSPNAVSLDASRFRVQRRRLWKVLRPRRVYAAGSEYSPKLVRILPSRAPEQAGKRVSSTPLPVAHLGSSNPLRFHSLPLSRAWGRGYSKAPPQRERRGSGVPEQAGPLRLGRLPAAANQQRARRGHFLVGRPGCLRRSLVRVSRIGLRAGPERPRPAQAWRPVPRLRVGLPRLSLAAPCSAMSKPPPKPVKPGKSCVRCARAGLRAAGPLAGVPEERPRTLSTLLARTS